MANTIKEAVKAKIEIIDQPEEIVERKQKNVRLILPVAILILATISTFILVRRFLTTNEEK